MSDTCPFSKSLLEGRDLEVYFQKKSQGLLHAITFSNGPFCIDTAKDLWDARKRQMRGSEYGEQDRKAAILYEYETFKATEREQLFDTYLRYLQKQYGTLMRQIKNLMDINIDALYKILKQNQGDVNDALGYKKKVVVVTSDPLALVVEKTKVSKCKEKAVVQSESEGSDDEDISDLKKITALLGKAFNRKKYYAKPTNNNLRTSSASSSANKNPEYVKLEEKKEDKKADEKKRDMSKTKMLLAKKDSNKQVLLAEVQAWMESSSDLDQEINANMVFMAKMEKVLSDSNASSSSAKETIAELAYYTSESESKSEYETSEYYDNFTNYGLFVNDDDQETFHEAVESAIENFNENHIASQKDSNESGVDHNDSEEKDHLVDKLIRKFNHKIAKSKELRPSLYDERVIGLGYTLMFLTHSNKALKIEKFKRARENKTKFAYDYGNLNASYVNEKINFLDDYFQEIINPDFKKIDSSFQQTSSLKPYVPTVILEKIIIDLEDAVSQKHLVLQKSNTSNDDLSSVSHSKLNKDVKRYSRKDLFSCNNSHLGDTRNAYACNDAINVSCNSSLYASYDENDLFIFDDVSVRNSQVSKMPFRKKPRDSINVSQVSETLKKDLKDLFHNFYDEHFDASNIMKSSTMNVETSNVEIPSHEEEVFHESSKLFQEESSSSSLNDDVQQSSEKVKVPSSNTQSVSNNMVPNVDEAIARIEAIRLFLAYAAHKDFTVFQMDVKIVFLNRILKGELYVGEPLGFVSKKYPDHVYALDKALYGLKQAHRAWYGVLSQFLIESGFQNDLMVKRFEMSMMGEMKFFLGLQVNQFSNGIFINQSKYIFDILKQFGMENCDTVPTLMVEQAKLKLDLVEKLVDHTDYRSMIGSLMYVTSRRPDIMFATCMCARYQANPNEHNVLAVKRIFRYLKGTINLGLWYPKYSGFDLTAYSDIDHARYHLDQKVKIAFENDDSSSRVELIPSKIKCANKVVLNFHKEFSVFSSFKGKENDGLLQNKVFKHKKEVVINNTIKRVSK
nr:retrovirus-related Pol polyprotein from transposon TNT 1-94 [Tanacetum cinerariifolium]